MERKKILILVLAVAVFFSLSPTLCAEEEKDWEIRNYQTARINTRDEDDSAYLTRIAAFWRHVFWEEFDAEFEFQPFAETRYLWDEEEWQRTEAGAELGFRLAKCAYVGESIHYAWLEGEKDTPELETRLAIDIPIVLNSKGYKITATLLDEYTYSVEEGEATRNEIAALFYIPVFKYLELSCGWRHIDRIHDFDSDQVELSAILKF